jgi:hypothetical protein
MTDDVHLQQKSAAPEDELPAREQVARVLDDVRELVQAELSYYRSRIDYSRHVVKWSWRFAAISTFAFGGASIALVMGLVLTLAPKVGPLAATLIVTISFAVIGGLAGFKAREWMRKIYFPEIDGDGDGIS